MFIVPFSVTGYFTFAVLSSSIVAVTFCPFIFISFIPVSSSLAVMSNSTSPFTHVVGFPVTSTFGGFLSI